LAAGVVIKCFVHLITARCAIIGQFPLMVLLLASDSFQNDFIGSESKLVVFHHR
jgi:hypothetical protein